VAIGEIQDYHLAVKILGYNIRCIDHVSTGKIHHHLAGFKSRVTDLRLRPWKAARQADRHHGFRSFRPLTTGFGPG
jgi:hypothetical protein